MPLPDLTTALTAAYQAEIINRGHTPVLDEPTRSHISSAAQWLADPRAKTGLMLQGLYGNGKSTLMYAICRLINYLYHSPISTERITIRTTDAKEIARLGSRDETRPAYTQLTTEPLLAIDDLGEEPAEIINYGMIHTPVRDLLLQRYRCQRITIVTTNLINTKADPQLSRHYGERVVDRIREMMHIITFTNPSYRNKLYPLPQ